MSIHSLITYFGYLVLVINTFLFFKSYRQESVAFKIICFYLLLSLVIQLSTEYLFSKKINNLFLSHYYFVGQFIMLSFFYKSILTSDAKKKVVSLFLILIPFFITVIYVINPLNYFKFNLVEIILTSLPIIFFSLLYFTETLTVSKKYIYFNSGVFIYLVSSTFLFSVGNLVNSSSSSSTFKIYVWTLNVFLYAGYQLLIFIEWYKNFRKNPKKLLKKIS